MKPLVLGTLALLALAACSPSPPAATPTSQPTSATSTPTPTQDPDTAIREAFDLYVAAVNAKNLDAALELTSSSAFARFDELRKHAVTSTEDQLAAALPSGPRSTVYVLRATADPAQLRSGTGHSIMSFAIEHGLIAVSTSSKYVKTDGTTTVTQTKPVLTKLVLNDDRASAELGSDDPVVPQSAVSLKLAFQRENGEWKVDCSALLDSATVGLEALAGQKGVTVDQVITEALTARYGAARAAELRKPIN